MTGQNGENVRKRLVKGELKLLNIYFSAYPPVDDYEFRLEKPYQNPDFAKVEVISILVDRAKGLQALKQIEGIFEDTVEVNVAHHYSDQEVAVIKKSALSKGVSRAKAEQAVFSYGKPFFTYIFIAIQIVVYLLLEAAGGSTDITNLDRKSVV